MKAKLFLFFILISTTVFSQTPGWQWAKSVGGNVNDEAFSVAADVSGNVITAGYFQSPSITFSTTTLTNAAAGVSDIFIAKYDASGNVLWAKRAGGANGDRALSVTTDPGGNILLTGYFSSPGIVFGTTTLFNSDNSGNSSDIFVVKYDSNGNVIWAKSAPGGLNSDEANSIATDALGNVFITGEFRCSIITFGTITLSGTSSGEMFVAKLDALGNFIWANQGYGWGSHFGRSICSDPNGNILVAGSYTGSSIGFGTGTLNNTDISGNTFDAFLVKYDASGNVIWYRGAGGSYIDDVLSVATDPYQNIIVAGYFRSDTIFFNSHTLNNTNGSSDLFLVKYSSNGSILWTKSATGSDFDQANSVSTDMYGSILVTGSFSSASLTFGSFSVNCTNTGTNDIFIAKCDTSGNVIWLKNAGGSNVDLAYSVANDAAGNVFVAGSFQNPSIVFGSTTLFNTDNSGNTNDLFLAKLSDGTGIKTFGNNFEFVIYPNPSSGKFMIDTGIEKGKIEIYNSIGEEIYSSEIISNKTPIDLSARPKGVYLIKIQNEEKVSSKKIIIS